MTRASDSSALVADDAVIAKGRAEVGDRAFNDGLAEAREFLTVSKSDRAPLSFTKGKWTALRNLALETIGAHVSLRHRLAAMETRLAALEAGTLAYVGVHEAGRAYKAGECCTYGGSLWIARAATSARPGSAGSQWQLACKRGSYSR